jgi:hypothetical protein
MESELWKPSDTLTQGHGPDGARDLRNLLLVLGVLESYGLGVFWNSVPMMLLELTEVCSCRVDL